MYHLNVQFLVAIVGDLLVQAGLIYKFFDTGFKTLPALFLILLGVQLLVWVLHSIVACNIRIYPFVYDGAVSGKGPSVKFMITLSLIPRLICCVDVLTGEELSFFNKGPGEKTLFEKLFSGISFDKQPAESFDYAICTVTALSIATTLWVLSTAIYTRFTRETIRALGGTRSAYDSSSKLVALHIYSCTVAEAALYSTTLYCLLFAPFLPELTRPFVLIAAVLFVLTTIQLLSLTALRFKTDHSPVSNLLGGALDCLYGSNAAVTTFTCPYPPLTSALEDAHPSSASSLMASGGGEGSPSFGFDFSQWRVRLGMRTVASVMFLVRYFAAGAMGMTVVGCLHWLENNYDELHDSQQEPGFAANLKAVSRMVNVADYALLLWFLTLPVVVFVGGIIKHRAALPVLQASHATGETPLLMQSGAVSPRALHEVAVSHGDESSDFVFANDPVRLMLERGGGGARRSSALGDLADTSKALLRLTDDQGGALEGWWPAYLVLWQGKGLEVGVESDPQTAATTTVAA